MKRVLSYAAVLSVFGWLSLSAIAGEHGHQDRRQAVLGEKAPGFTLKDVDGHQHKLSDYQGKVVVLEWTNCTYPYVVRHQKELKTMQKTFAAFKGKDVIWLAIDSTRSDHRGGYTVEKIKAWASDDAVNLPYPVLRDENGKVGHLFGAKTTPHMFVIDKNGVLVYAGAIDDDPHGTKTSATNYVQAAVKAALVGTTVEIASSRPYGCSVKYVGK